jgi:hypothetical protein
MCERKPPPDNIDEGDDNEDPTKPKETKPKDEKPKDEKLIPKKEPEPEPEAEIDRLV